MLLDRALRLAVRNYSTLFITVAVVTVTLHLAHAFVFRDVFAVSELHIEISNLRPSVRLQGVGPREVARSDLFFWVITAVEILLIPLFIGAARRILQVDRDGGVPTAPDALRNSWSGFRSLTWRLGRSGWVTVLAGAGLALGIGYLFERAGLLLTEVLSDEWLFLGAGLVRGLSRAVAAPFFLTAAVVASEQVSGERPRA